MALTTAAEYAKANGYSEDVATVIVHSGSEPGMFTCNFLGWDAEASKKFVDPYEAKLAAAMASNPADEASPKRMSVLKKTPTKDDASSRSSSRRSRSSSSRSTRAQYAASCCSRCNRRRASSGVSLPW